MPAPVNCSYIAYAHFYTNFQENDLKRSRALKKTKAEQELGRQKDREIDRLSQELDEHSTIVREQKEEITRYSIYQRFMERVLDYSGEVRLHV